MKRTPLKKISKKQEKKNIDLSEVRKSLPEICEICGRPASDLAHMLERSLYPEYYTEPWNCHALCRECHTKFDSDPIFRRKQKHLYNIVKEHDRVAADKHFRMTDKDIKDTVQYELGEIMHSLDNLCDFIENFGEKYEKALFNIETEVDNITDIIDNEI